MSCIRILTVLATILACTLYAGTTSTRGRVQIKNNTIVTDQNTRLRATDVWIWQGNYEYMKFSQDSAAYPWLRSLGFNTVRLCATFIDKYQDPQHTVASSLPYIAKAIKYATMAKMYVVLDYHDVGNYNLPHLKEFWNTVAPRYKNNTNVLFELANEPVRWSASDYTDQNVRDQEEVYRIIRSHAPSTHIIMLSVANLTVPVLPLADKLTGIDWTNASVGFHAYNCKNMRYIDDLRAKYSVICTEFIEKGMPENYLMFVIDENGIGRPQGQGSGELSYIKLFEERGISWLTWVTGTTWKWSPGMIDTFLKDAKARGFMWQPDDYTLLPTPVAAMSSSPRLYPMQSVQTFDLQGRLLRDVAQRRFLPFTDGTGILLHRRDGQW